MYIERVVYMNFWKIFFVGLLVVPVISLIFLQNKLFNVVPIPLIVYGFWQLSLIASIIIGIRDSNE